MNKPKKHPLDRVKIYPCGCSRAKLSNKTIRLFCTKRHAELQAKLEETLKYKASKNKGEDL